MVSTDNVLPKHDKNSMTKASTNTVIMIIFLKKTDKVCFYPSKVTFTTAFKAARFD